EFQFGTNWARFSSAAGGVVGFTLAMEGLFAFFAESTFLGLFLYGEKKLGPRGHFVAASMVFAGSWLSGYFIIVTNAFMQHPLGYTLSPDGVFSLADFGAYVFNPWAIWEYAHTMTAAVITGAIVVASIAAFWLLQGQFTRHAQAALRVAIMTGLAAAVLQLFPTGDRQGKLVAEYQPIALAAMEGKFESTARAELAIVGQPNVEERRLENPIVVPGVLSFLAYGSFGATVVGLNDAPRDQWPDNVELLYFAYHIMVGLGTLLLALLGIAAILLWRGTLFRTRSVLWTLMLAAPFPYIATTAGWTTAELGRQPWVVYGILRTSRASSTSVAAGDVAFTTIGFMGLYLLVGMLFVVLLLRQIARGPAAHADPRSGVTPTPPVARAT
ncbi:MAG TPA: cytochrome ubiquinol oxidase subunit I, partial [Candidatus Tumulicola sp.]|nr:cytochrome ubiquinol oxidase subunit I [Candidatus Tumulicola sp.]